MDLRGHAVGEPGSTVARAGTFASGGQRVIVPKELVGAVNEVDFQSISL